MPKAEKEFVLNYTMNRWQLNFKRNVGATSDSVRMCNPANLEDWKIYYNSKLRTKEHIDNLGKMLYKHITDDLPNEERFHPNLLNSITEKDCIDYMHMIVIDRVFNGFMKERGKS